MRNLNLLVLRCGNIERSKAFYELFGMAFQKEQHGNGPVHYSCVDDTGVFELYPLEGGVADQTGLGFVTGDLDGLHTGSRRNFTLCISGALGNPVTSILIRRDRRRSTGLITRPAPAEVLHCGEPTPVNCQNWLPPPLSTQLPIK